MEFLAAEWFWALVQAVGVLVTLGLIYRQIRLQTATHVVQTLGAIHQRWTEEAMLRARHSVCSRYLAHTSKFDGVSEYIAEYMEELGGYVKMKAVPAQVMWDAQSWYLEHYFCMFKDGIHAMRKTYHDETLYSSTEALFTEMSAYSKKRGAPGSERGEVDLQRFAESELQVAAAFLDLHANRWPLSQSSSSAE